MMLYNALFKKKLQLFYLKTKTNHATNNIIAMNKLFSPGSNDWGIFLYFRKNLHTLYNKIMWHVIYIVLQKTITIAMFKNLANSIFIAAQWYYFLLI